MVISPDPDQKKLKYAEISFGLRIVERYVRDFSHFGLVILRYRSSDHAVPASLIAINRILFLKALHPLNKKIQYIT